MENKRSPQSVRKAVSLTVKLAHRGIEDFVEKYATNISVGGLFIRTREPQALGTVVRFKIEIANSQRVMQGTAIVKWIRGPADPAGPPGMGLEFKDLDDASHAVVKRILAGSPSSSPGVLPIAPAIAPAIAPVHVAAARAVNLDLDELIQGTPAPAHELPVEPLAPESFSLDPELSAAATEPRPKPRAAAATRAAAGKPIFLEPPAAIDEKGPVIGIDLGTSNTCCAVLVNGKPQIPRSGDGYALIPSIVALGRQGVPLVGSRAKSQLVLNPSQVIYGAKRLVGRDYDSQTVRQVRERFHYQIVAGTDGKAAVKLGPHVLSLEEVQGLILQECKEMAERHLGTPVSRAVITCPAYYSEQQRGAVRRAGAMAGLKVERLINEPTAAALAYGLGRGLAKKVLVYDLGGGTFDATLLRIDDNVFEVLATGGDIFLGGMDFDNQLVDELLARFAAQHGAIFTGDPVALSRVAAEAERIKIALSERTQVEAVLPVLQMTEAGQPLNLEAVITRDELNAICADLVDRTVDVVKDVLLDAKLKMSDVDDIVLVGGMSRLPLVRERLKALLGKAALASVNADEAVALGAALFAGTVGKVSDVVLIDVVPMTIGIGLPSGGFKRIIERNTPLPATASFALSTSKDNEAQLELNLFQGEDGQVVGNEYIGTVTIDRLPPGPKGSVQVAIKLKLDAECVLHVEVRELRTRTAFVATIATRFTTEQVCARLGIPANPNAGQGRRAKDLAKRAGQFWSFVKRVVGKGEE